MDHSGKITTLDELHTIYQEPREAAKIKVAPLLTAGYRTWIERSKFCMMSTVGPEGTDCSPRGDEGPVVKIIDEHTLILPDWLGNNRVDTLRNIIRDGRISLMFMINGSNNVIRVNGRAYVSKNEELIDSFERKGKKPRTVSVITIEEVYVQCARALIRSGLWTEGDQSQGLPSVGKMLSECTDSQFDGQAYDEQWQSRANKTMW